MGFPALLILDLNLVSNQTMLQHYHLDVSALFTCGKIPDFLHECQEKVY